MEFQLKYKKRIKPWALTPVKSATFCGENLYQCLFFIGSYYCQCFSTESNFISAAAVVVIVFASLQCLLDSSSLSVALSVCGNSQLGDAGPGQTCSRGDG